MFVLQNVSLLFKFFDSELKLQVLLLVLVHNPIMVFNFEFKLFVFLDAQLEGFALLCKDYEKLFQLFVGLPSCFKCHIQLLLYQVMSFL